MFQIPYNQEVADWYLNFQKPICVRRINGIKNFENIPRKLNNVLILNFLHDLEANLDTILIGNPKKLLDIDQELRKKHPIVFGEKEDETGTWLYGMISDIFNYKSFRDNYRKETYELTQKLGISICPYCNREFIFTIQTDSGNWLIRPELDHYFPQVNYPMLALSLCNLIPSGHICNSNIKGTRNLDITLHLHPYIKEKDGEFHFITEMTAGENDKPRIKIDIDAAKDSKVRNTFEFFRLLEIYSCHCDIAQKIRATYNKYPPDKLDDFLQSIKKTKIKMTKEEALKILFSEFIIEEPDKEILGKLKQDLYREIRILYLNE